MRSQAIGIIPARFGSTRFPGKPLFPIAGKPLLRHVWERCRRSRSLASVIIATDDMRIAETAFDWGAEVALTAKTHVSGTDRVAEVAATGKKFEFIVNIQGDEPLTDPRLIDRLVDTLRKNRQIGMVTAAHPFTDETAIPSPDQVKVVIDRNGTRSLLLARTNPAPQESGDGIQDFATSGHLRVSPSDVASVCAMETKPARARRSPRAIARTRKWCNGSCARHKRGFTGHRYPG